MKSKIFLIISCLVLMACGGNPPRPVEVPVWVPFDCGEPPRRDTMALREVQWRVLQGPEGTQLFTLTPEMYENLGKNTADWLNGSRQQKAIIEFYERCIEESKRTPKQAESEREGT